MTTRRFIPRRRNSSSSEVPMKPLFTALLLVDVQKGVNEVKYYGGPSGKRNNHSAEENMRCLLAEWRRLGKCVAFTRHNSREINSPLKLDLETGNQIEGLEINGSDIVVEKDVNSGFIGT